jgi:NADH-quinone oxidoreductase subunit A
MTLGDYLPLLTMVVLASLFAGLSVVISKLLAPQRPTPEKLAAYECGIVPEREPVERFPVKFYLIAMVFVLFDIEIIFMYPWAVIYHELKLFGFVEMLIFIVILLVAYVYIWRNGVLDWSPPRRVARRQPASAPERKAA